MNEWDAFDRDLADALTDLPPSDEIVGAVTPWRQAMDRVVLGLCLTCFTLNFLYLQYLFPAVGAVQLYLGFRSLRTENRWFRLGWAAACCKAISLYIRLLLAATPLAGHIPAVFGYLGTGLTLLLFLSLRQGLRRAAASLGRTPRRDPALWACVWYLVLLALALFWPRPGWPVFFLMVFGFYRVVRALVRVTAELENWGCAVAAAPVRVSAGRLKAVYFGSLAGLLLLAMVLNCHLPLRGTVVEHHFDPRGTAALQASLAEMGFGETWSRQLLPEDLETLADTVRFGSNSPDLTCYGDDPTSAYHGDVFVFQLADGSVRFLHFFSTDDTGGFWRCGLTIRAAAGISDVICRLSYRQSGQSLTARLSPGECTETGGIDFFGNAYRSYTVSLPPFSWPAGATERRGYVLFTADQAANPKTVLDEQLFYGRDRAPRYPFPAPDSYHDTWRFGSSAYFGDGSSLLYKADQKTP